MQWVLCNKYNTVELITSKRKSQGFSSLALLGGTKWGGHQPGRRPRCKLIRPLWAQLCDCPLPTPGPLARPEPPCLVPSRSLLSWCDPGRPRRCSQKCKPESWCEWLYQWLIVILSVNEWVSETEWEGKGSKSDSELKQRHLENFNLGNSLQTGECLIYCIFISYNDWDWEWWFSYVASVTEARGVHASSHHLHYFLWQGHEGRLLPFKDVLTKTQLANIPHTKDENVARLFAMTPVRD